MDRWRRVFVAAGRSPEEAERSLGGQTDVEAYLAGQRGEPLAIMLEAVQVLHELGNDRGREAILQARRACSHVQPPAADAQGPGEESIDLLIASKTIPREEDVLAIASVLASRQDAQKSFEFRGSSVIAITAQHVPRARLEERLAELFTAYEIQHGIRVTCTDWQGDVIIRVLHGERSQVVHEMRNRSARRRVYVPAAYDLIRYSPATGMLAIRSRVTLVPDYRNIVGLVLFGSQDFFAHDDLIDLTPLRRRDALRLASSRGDVLVVHACAISFRTNLGRTTLAGRDCYQQAEIEGLAGTLAESDITSATLDFTFTGTGRVRCRVQLGLPNIFKPSDPRRRDQVRAALRGMGILRERGAESVSGELSLMAVESLQAWRDRFGSDVVDRCQRRGILVEAPAPQDAGASRAGQVIEIPGLSGGARGVVVNDGSARNPELLRLADQSYYRMDVLRVAALIGEALHISMAPVQLGPGVVAVGRRVLTGGQIIHCFLVVQEPTAAMYDELMRQASPAQPILVLPHGVPLAVSARCACTSINLPAVEDFRLQELLWQVLQGLRLHDQVPPHEWAPPSYRLVINRRTGAASWERVAFGLTGDDLERLVALAQAAPGTVTKDTLSMGQELSLRTTISRLKQRLPESLRSLIKAVSAEGYTLQATALVI